MSSKEAIEPAPETVELSTDQLDAVSGGAVDAGEAATGAALIATIAAEGVAVAGLGVVGAVLGATHTKT